MTALPPSPSLSTGGRRKIARIVTMVILVAAAFALRGRYFGIPHLHVDEQFYLLVGDRILNHGAIPYVDIWDRKPVGLFLLYAGIRLLGGDGIVQYQVVATLFAAATAVLIAGWSARFSGWVAATVAGLFYLVLTHKFSGYGGEAEIFLNLLTTASAWLVARHLLIADTPIPARIFAIGLAAMFVSGLALQIKPTSAFPGMFLGLTLIFLAWEGGWRVGRIALASCGWVFAALLPTLAVVGWYAAHGYLDELLFANVRSIGMRGSVDWAVTLDRFRSQAMSIGLPLGGVLAVAVAASLGGQGPGLRDRRIIFVLGWLAAALVAFLSVGTFYNNYALIVMPMLCVTLGAVARPKGIGWLAIGGAALMSAYVLVGDQRRVREQQAQAPEIYELSRLISANLDGGCLYVHRGLPIFYHLAGGCIATRYPFPDHLSLAVEGTALDVDPVAEVKRILASKPTVIVTNPAIPSTDNPATSALVSRALAANYRTIGSAGPFTAYRLVTDESNSR